MLKKIIKSSWFWLIIGVVLFRICLLFLALNGIPDVDVNKQDWLFNAGSDARSYFNTAKSFFEHNFKLNPLGLPLVLSPIIFFFKAESLNEIAKIAVVLQTVVFYSLTTILVYFLSLRFLKKKSKAIYVAIFFNIYPYLFYYFVHFLGSGAKLLERSNEVIFMWFSFLGILSEPLASLLMLFSLYLLLKISDEKIDNFKLPLLLGLAGGFALITRFQNAVIVPLYGLILILQKKFKSLFFIFLGVLPFLALQIFADVLYGSSWFNVDYRFSSGNDTSEGMLVGFQYMHRIIRYPLENCPWFFVPMGLIFLFLGFGIFKLIKQDKKTGLILCGYLAVNIIPFLFLESAIRNPRYFLPVLPVVFIFMFAGLDQAWQLFKKNISIG